jgi:glycosyltransferase involved in cell wall biosynthesis
VTFTGRVGPDEIAALYDAHDIYLQSPDIDNMPTSVIEAFACGLPVVSTDAGGVPAIVTHNVHGLLAPLDDHVTLGAHIISLLEDPDRARRYVRAAYDSIQGCTWSAVRDQWLRAYRSTLDAATISEAVKNLTDPVVHR